VKIQFKQWAAGFLAALFLLAAITPEPYIVKLTFLGDIMLGRSIARAASQNKNWRPFDLLQPIFLTSDITAANLESPLTTAPVETSGYALCAPPEQVNALKTAGFNLLTLANNHILDCGINGLHETRLTLQSFGMQTAGPENEPVFYHNHDSRFAFFALDDVSTAIDLPAVIQNVHRAANQADWVILSIHWGSEYQPAPSQRQRNLAATLINAGADVIIGHHPHVVQPTEMITRNNGNKSGIVFYSLGNAIFDQHGLPDTRSGEMVSLYFSKGKSVTHSIQHFEIDSRTGVILKLVP
jgi:poly-gamma-glutamate synthesis protein (capsule biosynthesis protein)